MKYLLFLFLGISALFLLYEFYADTGIYSSLYAGQSMAVVWPKIVGSESTEMELFSKCKLVEFDKDGWTNEIIEMADVNENPIKNCDDTFTTFTILDGNGKVSLNPSKKGIDGVKCEARTISWLSEHSFNSSSWIPIEKQASKVFESDFIETKCVNFNNVVVEKFIHTQIWRTDHKEFEKSKEATGEKPNVFIIVLDSVSNNQVRRSLPKTVALLEHEFEAINMRHLNKVGENSLPNGVAFLLGKLATDLDKGIFGRGKEKAEWNIDSSCSEYVDDQPFILKEFEKKGYKTMMAEDWGVFTYNCKGFKNLPATHYMRPFYAHWDDNKEFEPFMGKKQCLEPHTFLLDYMTKFANSYKGSPKISFLWAAILAHNVPDRLFHVDNDLFNHLLKHRKLLDKSYVFFMADHGPRFGDLRKTSIGDLETSNPLLFVSVPKHLRERLNPILRENSNKLITQFDIHASLIDIVNDPQVIGQVGDYNLRGQSLLRALSGERTCRMLPIPIQFCTCQWNKTKSTNIHANEAIGRGAVNVLNNLLEDVRMVDRCKTFSLKTATEVKVIDGTDGLTEITFTTNECSAEFKSIVRIREMESGRLNVTRAANDFTRMDEYGKTAACISDRPHLRPLCCCRS